MPKPLQEQVIVITGASSGIGLATAREAARRGARVVLAARNERDLAAAVEEIRASGGEAVAVVTDVAHYSQVEQLAKQTVETFGHIDTWVNNAGVSAYATFEDLSLEDFRRIVDINFMGQVHGAKAALPYLEETAGALICVGSVLSDHGAPLQGAYSASKHAIKGWLDSLRVELKKEGSPVRITLVKPSSVNTPLFSKAKTQMGVMPRPMAPVYDPELGARAILRAAEGNERDVFVGGVAKGVSLVERISPRLLDLQQRLQAFESQQSDRPKPESAENNLYTPLAEDGGVTGEFEQGSRHRSPYQSFAETPPFAALALAALLGFTLAVLHRERARRRQSRLSLFVLPGARRLAL